MILSNSIRLYISLFFIALVNSSLHSQEKTPSENFWGALQELCGNAYEGTLVLPEGDDPFAGKTLIMHVRSCTDTIIKIPFFVGEDKSRTWVLTRNINTITLKHDHRHEDGSPDAITMYGGTSTNSGQDTLQVFPADIETQKIIPAASGNIWWITLDDTSFTYNLRRLGTERVFKVTFDLSKTVSQPSAPWGWKE